VIAQCGDQLCGYVLRRVGFEEGVFDTVVKLVGLYPLERQAHAHAAGKGEELIGAEALDQPPVTGEDDGEENMGVESRRRQETQLGQASPVPHRR
jgi:hypothetical protein